jgi:hypothetical protein
MPEQSKVYGDLGSAAAPIGQIPQGIGYPIAEIETTPAGSFNPTTDMIIERLLDGVATTSPQEPAGLGVSNLIQVDFGAGSNTVADPVMLSAAGALTINDTGTYRIKIAMQFGRTGASGTSVLLFRVLVNGTQAGRSVEYKLTNANKTSYFENDTWITLPAGTVVTVEIMRDASGTDFGGLFGFDPTVEAGSWNSAPSAALRVERWVTTP